MFLTPALERESFESFVPLGGGRWEVPCLPLPLPLPWCFPPPPLALIDWRRFFVPSWLVLVECFFFLAMHYGFGVFCSPGLDSVVVVVPRQKTKRDLGWEVTFWCVFPAESLT
jgi:hypothetical protein